MSERRATEVNSQPLLIITGPTAVGKSEVALEVAERLSGEIISADSRQIYRFLDAGTAKPSIAEATCAPRIKPTWASLRPLSFA